MRWRVLVNSLERTGARDTFERFSIAIEEIGPIVTLALFLPSAVALAGLSGYAGYDLAVSASPGGTFTVLKYFLLGATILCLVGPILMPSAEQTSAVRLLLLPILARVLYAAQAFGTISDPWILLVLPVIFAFPLGLAAGGAFGTAAAALAAGLLLILVFMGLSILTTMIVHLIVRDRRRGELVALAFIVILPFIGLLPSLLDAQERRASRRGAPRGELSAEQHEGRGWLRSNGAARAFSLTPSQQFVAATRVAHSGGAAAVLASLATLAAWSAIVHGIALLTFGWLLASPGAVSRRRSGARSASGLWKLPGLSPGVSAVALAQVRLALRTPRGRSILISPLLVFVVFAFIMRRSLEGLEVAFVTLDSGLGLATFGAAVCLLSILPIAMNQFAVDRAGLTLALLAPLRDMELLAGKAVGNAAIAAVPALLCIAIALLLFPAGDPALWLSLPLGLAAAYLLTAPAAAALSAIFPRAVDLNSIGRGSNAHGAASLLGMLVLAVSAVPSAAIVMTATRLLERPMLAPVLLLIWCAVAFAISRLLFVPVAALFSRRRENLPLLA
jgi:hypothetical protein